MSTTAATSAGASSSIAAAKSSFSSVVASASKALGSESAAASGTRSNPAWFKYVGITLAILSGFLIGSSFVFKKKGLLAAQKKYSTVAGEGVSYLKSPMWWCGMILMIIVANLGGYSFAPAILVTPFGALSVVVCAVLSAIFLQETLTLFGKIGCFLCVIGSVVIALNGPSTHDSGSIVEFRKLFLSVGFLIWVGICITASVALVVFVAPRYGKRWMMVYIGICSLLGGLSVSTTSGLGAAIVLSIRGDNQLKNWFFYVLLVFVAITLVMEILYLNKALELFNTAMVTPAYFVTFTSASIISTIVLYKGLDASASAIVTLVMGFLVICTGIVLLQLSKVDPEELEEKDVPGLDRSTTLLMRASRSMASTHGGGEKAASTALEDPGIDTMRGAGGLIGSIVRARSSRRIIRASADEYAKLDEARGGFGMSQLNTGRRPDLERFTLHDTPMPDRSSMHSLNTSGAKSGTAGDVGLSGDYAAGLLSPRFINSQLPKRGESMISFTSESLAPHGHHAPLSSSEQHFASSSQRYGGSSSVHPAPTSGILTYLNSSSSQHNQAAPLFLGGSRADRQLSNIAESEYTDSMPTTPYSDPFSTAQPQAQSTTILDRSTLRADGSPTSAATSRANVDLRHSFNFSVSSAVDVTGGRERYAEGPQSIAPGLSPTKSLDSMHGTLGERSLSYSSPVFRSSPTSPKQYTDRSFPGRSRTIGIASTRQASQKSGRSGAASRQRNEKGRTEEEELLSPKLRGRNYRADDDGDSGGGDGDDDDDEDDDYDDDDDRRNSIRVIGGGGEQAHVPQL